MKEQVPKPTSQAAPTAKFHRLLILLVIFLFAGFPVKAHDFTAVNFDGDTIYYNITSDSTVAVAYKGTSFWDDLNRYRDTINIPPYVFYNTKRYVVTAIAGEAFRCCHNLYYITIPNTVTTLGQIIIAETPITSIIIPPSVTTMDVGALAWNSLVSVVLPPSITSIEDWTFEFCERLTSITIPSSVTSIGADAFNKCRSLSSIVIPSSVTTIKGHAFYNCTGLKSVIFADSSNLDTIGSGAFNNDQGKKGIRIMYLPKTVRYIDSIVHDHYGETHIDYYRTFSMVENLVYKGSFGDATETWGATYRVWAVDDQFIYADTNKTKLITALDTTITNLVIPGTVTEILPGAFENFTQLSTVDIPAGVTAIGDYAFMNCNSLTSVSIPSSITSIGAGAFYNCDSLSSITFPDSVLSIGEFALLCVTILIL